MKRDMFKKMGQVNDVNRLRGILMKRPEARTGADLSRLVELLPREAVPFFRGLAGGVELYYPVLTTSSILYLLFLLFLLFLLSRLDRLYIPSLLSPVSHPYPLSPVSHLYPFSPLSQLYPLSIENST